MLPFLIRLVISALALLGIANLTGGAISVDSIGDALIAALVLGLANAFIKPILEFIAQALTLPLSCLTLGLWSLILSWLLNGLMFLGVATVVKGFHVNGFGAALLGALLMSVVNALSSALCARRQERSDRALGERDFLDTQLNYATHRNHRFIGRGQRFGHAALRGLRLFLRR